LRPFRRRRTYSDISRLSSSGTALLLGSATIRLLTSAVMGKKACFAIAELSRFQGNVQIRFCDFSSKGNRVISPSWSQPCFPI
jgi:hypothetical protein